MTNRFDLTPRQAARILDGLTGLVVVSVAFALAGLTWRIAGHAGTGAVTVPAASLRPAAARPNVAPALALAPFGKAAQGEAAQPTALAITLQGVILANPAALSVAYISENGEAAVPLEVGAAIAGATIETIQRDRVLINNGGRIELLAFPDPFADPDAPQQAAAPRAGTAAAATPSAVAPPATPASAGAIIDRLDARPTDQGYAIGENAPPGLQPGDVIQSVNGASLTDPAAAQAAFEAAGRSGSARIQILRDGATTSITLPTR